MWLRLLDKLLLISVAPDLNNHWQCFMSGHTVSSLHIAQFHIMQVLFTAISQLCFYFHFLALISTDVLFMCSVLQLIKHVFTCCNPMLIDIVSPWLREIHCSETFPESMRFAFMFTNVSTRPVRLRIFLEPGTRFP